IKDITTQLKPFFEALNFFATKSNKINQTPIVSSTDQTANQGTDNSSTSVAVPANVSALSTLFQDTQESTPTPPSNQQSLLGDYLRKFLESLEKSDLPEGTSVSFSENHQDETYEINLKIQTPNGIERNLTIKLDKLNK
ncbi:hypothetical protein, partial [Mesomycoplasma ovipneumoniae]|uniref:hypothetical protein n=1 Tax=Mesomycoplasma ovipneumoniae TaxID=29562 RepID=UPI0030803E0C